jgi:hypothetical protein
LREDTAKRVSDAALRERLSLGWPLVPESGKPALAAEREIYPEMLAGKNQ